MSSIRSSTVRWVNSSLKVGGSLRRSIVPKKSLRRIAELHLERLGADREMAIVFQVELRGSIKFMQEFSAAGFAEYLDIIRGTIEDGQKARRLQVGRETDRVRKDVLWRTR